MSAAIRTNNQQGELFRKLAPAVSCVAENLTAEKKKPSETLTERLRGLAVIRFNRVCACCGMLHNSDYELCGTENVCSNRLREPSDQPILIILSH